METLRFLPCFPSFHIKSAKIIYDRQHFFSPSVVRSKNTLFFLWTYRPSWSFCIPSALAWVAPCRSTPACDSAVPTGPDWGCLELFPDPRGKTAARRDPVDEWPRFRRQGCRGRRGRRQGCARRSDTCGPRGDSWPRRSDSKLGNQNTLKW